MSHHISGPRAEAEPIADITDLYAFPSPEHPGRLVLVLNTLPFTPLSATFSDGLIYRFRLRPLTANTQQNAAPFAAGGEEIVLDCVFSAPGTGPGADAPEQEGTCVTPAGETVSIRVNDEHGGQTHGVRVFAGPRWDPFIMDAPTTLKTIATGKLAFTDPGAIYLDGKNVLSLVVEVDRAVLPGGADLFGVVAETLTRGSINVRLERAGRPEVPNLMLAPMQFDPVNRDLEIRDLYNMDDAFHLSHVYASAYRARLNANLRFWDGLDGKTDWPAHEDGAHPLTELILADFLVVDVTKPYAEQGSFLEIELAARRGEAHRTCGGRALNDDVMDTIFTLLVNAGKGPVIRDGVDQATRPASRAFPYLAAPNPDPPEAPVMGSDRAVTAPVTTAAGTALELDDIQPGLLHQRPTSYVGTYLLLRIDNREAGKKLVQRLLPVIESSRSSSDPARNAWVSVAFTYQGLKALGVPQDSLDSFAPEFRQGMAARAAELGDVGDSSPENWEKPLGSREVHVALSVLSPDPARLESLQERARRAHEQLPGVEVIWRQDCYQLPTGRTSFGFKDGIGQPTVEGSGIPDSNPGERPIKAGEFILGYPDETGSTGPVPTPEVLGRNGTYLAFRKLHTRVAAYRQYLRAKAASREDEALLGAKMVGRWPSGAPLALRPEQDDPDLGVDPGRNNRFGYGDDLRGFKCPAGAHARRANPRDALDHEMSVDVRLHRMLRLGTSYGPPLPDGVLEDDGADRGIVFVFTGAHLKRQFEFVKTQWLNDGIFIGAPAEKDPLAGPNDGTGTFTIPQRPIRRRLPSLPPFVITRGGEYCFAPGLRALRWLAEPDTQND